MTTTADAIIAYHQRTKHQLNAYAKGPEALDWDDQPNPFRRFSGCEIFTLPTPGTELPVLFADLDHPEQQAAYDLNRANLGLLLELSFGLSAWKQYGPDRWALRCNPSSGNLHPSEAYVLCSDAQLLPPGVYHYVSHDHHLEQRAQFKTEQLPAAVYIAISSIHWREAWKYGERAFRYCQHDVGHALAALSYAAACLGWRVSLCASVSDTELAMALGLTRTQDFVDLEHENADVLLRLHTTPTATASNTAAFLAQIQHSANWFGTAAKLSGRHFYRWPIIDAVAQQAEKPDTAEPSWQAAQRTLPPPRHNLAASQLIRQRRSAQHFNAQAADLPLSDFHRLLAALLPNQKPPFSSWHWEPAVHIVLFVHRVAGLVPGLYCLPRTDAALAALKQAFSASFAWQAIDAPVPLYLLAPGNVRSTAKTFSCHQAIASDSFFSLGMLSEFADPIAAAPWTYRRLFWECGLLGQSLYLEAEAAGVRGTGIGCFFDDLVHGLLGLQDNRWQSLYHFTVGAALEDTRIQTLAAYAHLDVGG